MNTPPWRTAFASAARHRPLGVPIIRRRCWRLYTVGTPPPPPLPPPKSTILSKAKTFAKYGGLFCLSSAIGLVALGVGILVHDAFTYNEKHLDRVPVNPLALHPERGGPKNLPIARVLVDDEEDDDAKLLSAKPKLVIVGAGWGVRIITFILEIYPDHPSLRLWVFFKVCIQEIITLRSCLRRLLPLLRRFFLVSNQTLGIR